MRQFFKGSKEFKSERILGKRVESVQKPDFLLLGCVIILAIFGLLMVYDSSQVEALQSVGDKYYFIRQQAIWIVLGFVSLAFFSVFDYHHLKRFVLPFFLISFLLLLLVFIPGLGVSAGGAHRWLRIYSLTIQPAEIIKLSTLLFLSALFQKEVRVAPFLLLVGAIVSIVGILQRDLGTAIVFSIIAFGIFYAANAPLKYLLSLIILGMMAVVGFIAIAPYRIRRVLAFLDPFADPQGYSYHIAQVLIAIGSGGLFGLGVGQSRQKYAYIPEVTTDSIFAIVGEEFGFVGSVILILLFAFLVYRGIKIAEKAGDEFGRLVACGITMWIGGQAVVNLSAMTSLIPLTGVPLPFISYGGSSLLANLTAIGILLNISKQGKR